MKEDKKTKVEEVYLGMNHMKEDDTLLQGMIEIPVDKPTPLNQCGTWSIVYPSEYTKQKTISCT